MDHEIDVVIGGSYGDEGKGKLTQYFTQKHIDKKSLMDPPLIIRFNGGSQAGHTVIHPNVLNGLSDNVKDHRHVCSSFGSGVLHEAPTYLSSFFCCNPSAFINEFVSIKNRFDIIPKVIVSPECKITTPYDVIINRILEDSRGDHRHGSVGMGMNETIIRDEVCPIRFKHLITCNRDQMFKELFDYVLSRIDQLNGPIEAKNMLQEARKPIEQQFSIEIDTLISMVEFDESNSALHRFYRLIFEGAQGLALDQNAPGFPHLTRSNTGIKNVASILEKFCIRDDVNINYCSRIYLTRHGAGPLENEHNEAFMQKFGFNIVDETNKPNQYQGSLRFAILDYKALGNRIENDLHFAKFMLRCKNVNTRVFFNCLDQYRHFNFEYSNDDDFFEKAKEVIFPVAHSSGTSLKFLMDYFSKNIGADGFFIGNSVAKLPFFKKCHDYDE
jgi:adenylosuccinate synthase